MGAEEKKTRRVSTFALYYPNAWKRLIYALANVRFPSTKGTAGFTDANRKTNITVINKSQTKRNIQKHSPKSRLKISHRFAQFECRLELVPQRGLSKLKRPFDAGSAAVQVKVPVYRLIYRAFYRVVVSMSKSLLYYLEIEKTLKKKPILCNPALSPQTSRFVLLCRIFF